MKQIIRPDGFINSIEMAFYSNFDVDKAAQRLKKIIANLPPEKLYYGKRNGWIAFYKRADGKQLYLPKESGELYLLARRRYLLLQLDIIELTGRRDKKSMERRESLIRQLQELIGDFACGNLDIARIVMTPKQYKWFTGPFRHKYIDPSIAYQSAGGVDLRSKSERDIMNKLEDFAVPVHYEEETSIDVHGLVDSLFRALQEAGKTDGNLFFYSGRACRWRVPKELEWMNTFGSIWATYNHRSGRITIYDDFRIMLACNEMLLWEHHGMCDDFIYRINAAERSMILKYTRTVPRGNMIETFERDVDSPDKITDVLFQQVLPRLWF